MDRFEAARGDRKRDRKPLVFREGTMWVSWTPKRGVVEALLWVTAIGIQHRMVLGIGLPDAHGLESSGQPQLGFETPTEGCLEPLSGFRPQALHSFPARSFAPRPLRSGRKLVQFAGGRIGY